MRCVIGIDGGGTKTLLRMTDLNGNEITTVKGGLTNICASTKHEVSNNLTDLIHQCFKNAPNVKIEAVCIGAAGVVAQENVDFFYKFLTEATGCKNVSVENDAYIALFANLKNRPGVSITAGTGSICCGKNNNGEYHRVGGWGHLFSDEGSAYAITVAALKETFKSFDKRRKPTLLLNKFLEKTGTDSAEELISRIYLSYTDKSDLAAISKIVDEAAAQKDDIANEILNNAANDLSSMCISVIERLDLSKEKFTVVLNGGVLKNSSVIKNLFRRKIKGKYPGCQVKDASKDAAWGAVYLALNNLNLS